MDGSYPEGMTLELDDEEEDEEEEDEKEEENKMEILPDIVLPKLSRVSKKADHYFFVFKDHKFVTNMLDESQMEDEEEEEDDTSNGEKLIDVSFRKLAIGVYIEVDSKQIIVMKDSRHSKTKLQKHIFSHPTLSVLSAFILEKILKGRTPSISFIYLSFYDLLFICE